MKCMSNSYKLALLLVGMSAIGCGDSEEDLEVARQSVVAALEAWKQGETPDQLQTRTPPIEFHDDDWQNDAKLHDYKVKKVYRDTDGRPRCVVVLSVERRGGKVVSVQLTYQANTDPKIVIDRDPYS